MQSALKLKMATHQATGLQQAALRAEQLLFAQYHQNI
ncbi:MAG: hypothetical protein RL571_3413 [Pseudomonadota bacterium]